MVSEQGMEKPRLKSLETEVSSLAASEERKVKEMQEILSAMNARLDQMSSSRAREQGECSYNAAHNSEKETLVEEAANKFSSIAISLEKSSWTSLASMDQTIPQGQIDLL